MAGEILSLPNDILKIILKLLDYPAMKRSILACKKFYQVIFSKENIAIGLFGNNNQLRNIEAECMILLQHAFYISITSSNKLAAVRFLQHKIRMISENSSYESLYDFFRRNISENILTTHQLLTLIFPIEFSLSDFSMVNHNEYAKSVNNKIKEQQELDKYLREYISNNGAGTYMEIAIKKYNDLDFNYMLNGKTALSTALSASARQVKVAKDLLANGAVPQAEDFLLLDPQKDKELIKDLFVACKEAQQLEAVGARLIYLIGTSRKIIENIFILDMFLQTGMDVDVIFEDENKIGVNHNSYLHNAVDHSQSNLVKKLIAAGANPFILNFFGKNASNIPSSVKCNEDIKQSISQYQNDKNNPYYIVRIKYLLECRLESKAFSYIEKISNKNILNHIKKYFAQAAKKAQESDKYILQQISDYAAYKSSKCVDDKNCNTASIEPIVNKFKAIIDSYIENDISNNELDNNKLQSLNIKELTKLREYVELKIENFNKPQGSYNNNSMKVIRAEFILTEIIRTIGIVKSCGQKSRSFILSSQINGRLSPQLKEPTSRSKRLSLGLETSQRLKKANNFV